MLQFISGWLINLIRNVFIMYINNSQYTTFYKNTRDYKPVSKAESKPTTQRYGKPLHNFTKMRSFFQIGECRDFLFFISQKPFSSLTTLQVQIIYRGRYYGVLIIIVPLHPPIWFVLVMSLERK